FIKDGLFPTPAIFNAIQRVSDTAWKEMYKVFNMGHRMEVYCLPEMVETVIAAAATFNIDARMVGRTEAAEDGNCLSLYHGTEIFSYRL
ncbi:MAG: phosphoribosylformylglycinamidine cyclo-ligase, partial [Gammaproteobacteria bacterium]|nr:phosphoribosylformylglycinamidine cyclo-ligase [Gammaproteobacteria bacterium]